MFDPLSNSFLKYVSKTFGIEKADDISSAEFNMPEEKPTLESKQIPSKTLEALG